MGLIVDMREHPREQNMGRHQNGSEIMKELHLLVFGEPPAAP